MAGHRDAPVRATNNESREVSERDGWIETKGKVLTPVHGFSGADVLSQPPDTVMMRGNAKKPGSRPLPLPAKNPATNALAAFGLGGTTPGKKAK
jgi:hypothetical protein